MPIPIAEIPNAPQIGGPVLTPGVAGPQGGRMGGVNLLGVAGRMNAPKLAQGALDGPSEAMTRIGQAVAGLGATGERIANVITDIGDHIRTLVVMRFYALLGQFLVDAVKWMLPGDDDEEIFQWENYTRALALGHINGIFLVGDAVSYGYSFLARMASTQLDDWGFENAAEMIGREGRYATFRTIIPSI